MIYNIYFSPTGSTQKVTTFVAKKFGECEDIDLSKVQDFRNYEFHKDDLCIVGVPSFGGRVPEIAIQRLKEVQAKQTPVVLICTYGNRDYEDTLLELKETLIDCGFLCVAAMSIICEHSIMHQFATGRPNEQDFEEMKLFVEKIKSRLSQVKEHVYVPGNKPYKEYHGIPLKPKASSKKCNQCGLCALRCPVQAIPIDNPNQTNKDLCISCMRCVKICPQHARKCSSVLIGVSSKKLKKICESRKENELFI